MKRLTELSHWQALKHHLDEIIPIHMRDCFEQDPERFSRFTISCGEILLDYSRNRIQDETLVLLTNLALEAGLADQIQALFNGHPLNITENRPAWHTALRDQSSSALHLNGEDIKAIIQASRSQLQNFVKDIHTQKWRGASDKPIKHIVNIGIGGSFLGPMMTTYALKDFAVSKLQFHFISSVDQAHLNEILEEIEPASTLFIISSKSFSTLETISNAKTLLTWMKTQVGEEALSKHFCAVTAATQKALDFGIPKAQIFPLWDWVGGRYSIWSAIGLPLLLMIGPLHFQAFIEGAYEMDQHFRQTSFENNMPVMLALLGIWYRNFFGTQVEAIVPYAERLRYLIPYLQQAEMESNGKCINLQGEEIAYATGPVIFGGEGCNGQHAYHQLLHQGQHFVPVDFILVGKTKDDEIAANHQDILIASGLSQAQALMRGKTYEEAYADLLAKHKSQAEAAWLAKHQIVPGNRPSNVLFLKCLTPHNLGALLALYEHKIFVQGIIWNINSFDQWGVELGKELLPAILRAVQGEADHLTTDSATAGMIHHFKKIHGQT